MVDTATMAPHHTFTPTQTLKPRQISKIFEATSQAEGAGATVRRSIGVPQLRNLTPFLMLDHFSVARGAGFPDHPHRGQETITYLLSGAVDHEDFAGNKGTIWPGDLQFMTAGKGIMHAEMPRHEAPEYKPVEGMQLWVDLPKHLKSCEPRYRDLRASEIPRAVSADGNVTVKVISGESQGIESLRDLAYTSVWFLDIQLRNGAEINQAIPAGWNAFVYVLSGQVSFDQAGSSKIVQKYHQIVLDKEGEGIKVKAVDEEGCRLIVVAGTPLDQAVVQYGPFVTTSKDEVYQALHDFQGFKNGFERAEGWSSEIGKVMLG